MSLRGMTWDHPRGYRPLASYAELNSGPVVTWDRQPLAAFEARPLAELAREYDLLVVDHPGLGAALTTGALRPLDEVVGAATLENWRARSVGRTWESYRLDGRVWAAPIDAATQVAVLRPDLVERAPGSWAEVVGLARSVPVTLCLGGPHALLGLLAMCASAGAVDGSGGDDLLCPDDALEAIEILREVYARADQRLSRGDPIEIHQAMAGGAGVAFCPLAYGYAAYARPAPGARPLRWADAPVFGSTRPGSVLGGTGLAVSAFSVADPDDVRTWLTGFLAPEVQGDLVPARSGQPAVTAVWDSPTIDAAWGGYYSATRRSLEHAHIRPRINGWIPLQRDGSAIVRDLITAGGDPRSAVAGINDRFRALVAATAAGEAASTTRAGKR